MERLNQILEPATKPTRGRPPQKRKWREIEELKEKFRLKKELEELDFGHEYSLDEIDF